MKHTDVSQWDDVSRTFVQQYDFELRPQGQIKRVFDESSCLTRNFFGFDIGLPYLAHGCITMRQCERTFMILIQHGYNIDLYSSSNNKVFDMSFCSTQNFCLILYRYTILDNHHKRMCRVQSWSRCDVELWHQGQMGQIYRVLTCLRAKAF